MRTLIAAFLMLTSLVGVASASAPKGFITKSTARGIANEHMRRSTGKKQGTFAGVNYQKATKRNYIFTKATESSSAKSHRDTIYVNRRTGAVTRNFKK
jgi:hypothetical protein